MADRQNQTTAGQQWAEVVRRGARGSNVIIAAINEATREQRANRGGVMDACAFVLAQNIVSAGRDDADAIRAGILALVDGYAMRVAVGELP